MLTSPSALVRLFARAGLVALAVALVLVPAVARARQQVEHRDETRLSIKHSWLGVAPQSKAFVPPQPDVVLPAIASDPGPGRRAARGLVITVPTPRAVRHNFRDPLRGPPASSRS